MKSSGGVSCPKFMLGAILRAECDEVIPEYKFANERKFRADYYVPELNLLVEYEGIYFAPDNGRGYTGASRHLNLKGYSTDCEKYNLAQILGYKLLRYTAQNYKQAVEDLRRLKRDLKVGGTD